MGQLSCKSCDYEKRDGLTEIKLITETEQDFQLDPVNIREMLNTGSDQMFRISVVIKFQSI